MMRTKITITEVLWNTQDFSYLKLTICCMMYPQKSFRHILSLTYEHRIQWSMEGCKAHVWEMCTPFEYTFIMLYIFCVSVIENEWKAFGLYRKWDIRVVKSSILITWVAITQYSGRIFLDYMCHGAVRGTIFFMAVNVSIEEVWDRMGYYKLCSDFMVFLMYKWK
jgi:hypothetical protein